MFSLSLPLSIYLSLSLSCLSPSLPPCSLIETGLPHKKLVLKRGSSRSKLLYLLLLAGIIFYISHKFVGNK